MTRRLGGASLVWPVAVLLALTGVSACGSSGSSSGGASATAAASSSPSSSPSSAASAGNSASPAAGASASASVPSSTGAGTTDPCRLVTAAEASSLAGTTFGAGQELTTGGTGRRCVYGSGSGNSFFVQTATAASASAAQGQWSADLAQAQQELAAKLPGLSAKPQLTELSGVGDKAAFTGINAMIAGHQVSLSAIYVLDGATFLAFGDARLGGTAPGPQALQAQAEKSLGRV